jgi:hypothetical protein
MLVTRDVPEILVATIHEDVCLLAADKLRIKSIKINPHINTSTSTTIGSTVQSYHTTAAGLT